MSTSASSEMPSLPGVSLLDYASMLEEAARHSTDSTHKLIFGSIARMYRVQASLTATVAALEPAPETPRSTPPPPRYSRPSYDFDLSLLKPSPPTGRSSELDHLRAANDRLTRTIHTLVEFLTGRGGPSRTEVDALMRRLTCQDPGLEGY